jgi:hypothetical protein
VWKCRVLTNFMKQPLSFEAASCTITKELPNTLWNTKFHYRYPEPDQSSPYHPQRKYFMFIIYLLLLPDKNINEINCWRWMCFHATDDPWNSVVFTHRGWYNYVSPGFCTAKIGVWLHDSCWVCTVRALEAWKSDWGVLWERDWQRTYLRHYFQLPLHEEHTYAFMFNFRYTTSIPTPVCLASATPLAYLRFSFRYTTSIPTPLCLASSTLLAYLRHYA